MIVTETRLENIANGYLAPERLDEPFVIIRTHERLGKIKEGCWCYTFVWGNKITRDNQIVDSLDIEPKTAKKLIKIYNMQVAKEDNGNRLYEQPANPFKKKFPCWIETKRGYN